MQNGPYCTSSLTRKRYIKTQLVINMLEFIIDNIFVEFGGHIFQQIIDIPMGINGAVLLVDLFLYASEAVFIQTLVKDNKYRN